ncbi:hypothetical protein CR513_30231, partial [Mucuna pruriens]
MNLAKELEAQVLTAKSDSKIVMDQVNGEYQARDPQLIKYWYRATKLAASFKKFTLLHVPQEADLLSKLESAQKGGNNWLVIHKNISKSTVEEPCIYCAKARQTWMDPLLEYFRKGTIPKDIEAAKRLKWETSK